MPTEGEGIKLIGSFQWTAAVQQTVAHVLAKKGSDVTVETRRLGGGK